MSDKPLISILIPGIPSRFDNGLILYNHLQFLVGGAAIEILWLIDNKKRSIGLKREALKNASRGKYFMFCDDDDWINSIDSIYEAAHNDVHVITFKTKCRNKDGSTFIVTSGLTNDVEHNTDGNGNYLDCKRPPFPLCAWNEKFKDIPYPDISYGEDWIWVKQALETAKTEIFINEVVNQYNFDERVTEASTEDNEYWKNPNR